MVCLSASSLLFIPQCEGIYVIVNWFVLLEFTVSFLERVLGDLNCGGFVVGEEGDVI
jgi:hypothetical protein